MSRTQAPAQAGSVAFGSSVGSNVIVSAGLRWIHPSQAVAPASERTSPTATEPQRSPTRYSKARLVPRPRARKSNTPDNARPAGATTATTVCAISSDSRKRIATRRLAGSGIGANSHGGPTARAARIAVIVRDRLKIRMSRPIAIGRGPMAIVPLLRVRFPTPRDQRRWRPSIVSRRTIVPTTSSIQGGIQRKREFLAFRLLRL